MKYFVFLFIILFSTLSYGQSKLQTCLSMAKQMNVSLPMRIDNITVLEATSCIEDKGDIFFQYVHIISNPSSLPRDIQAKSKNSAKQQFCKNSEFRNALKLFNFDFYYVDTRKSPLYSFTLRNGDC
jgi:hypothetical protein